MSEPMTTVYELWEWEEQDGGPRHPRIVRRWYVVDGVDIEMDKECPPNPPRST